jgi:hypothetical protein
MKFWVLNEKKKKFQLSGNIWAKRLKVSEVLIFQIFNDLCTVRNWKKLKIIKTKNKDEHLIIGIGSNHKNSKKNVEVFLPIVYSSSVLDLRYLSEFHFIKLFKNFVRTTFVINIAFIDRDSSLSYY